MNKSFFQKTYQIIQNFFFLDFICFFLYVGIQLLSMSISNIHIYQLDKYLYITLHFLNVTQHFFKMIICGMLTVTILLLCIEMIQRIKYDNLWNYFKSIRQTRQLRQFLKQEEKTRSIISIDEKTTVTEANPILEQFNRTIDKCLVDVRNKSVTVYLQYPKTQQAQKLLKNMENHIMEEISNQNPDYYFSTPSREGNRLWYIGTKR